MAQTALNRSLSYLAHQQRSRRTPIEKAMWKFLEKRPYGLVFHQQFVLAPYIVDFYCPKLKLAVEVDGRFHEQRTTQDIERNRALATIHDVKVIHFQAADVFNGSAMRRLKGYLASIHAPKQGKYRKRKKLSWRP